MSRLPTGLLLSIALLTMVLPVGDPAQAATVNATTVKFGMDANSVAAQKAAGVAPDYGTFWVGPWTLSSGWAGPDGQMTNMKNAGVTPAIHFYYWGDDISPSCVENGCWSSLHNAQKTRAGWEQLGTQLTDHLDARMGGAPVVIFLESEFNKGGIETYEPFDGYMADMAAKIHANYPNAIIVLGFGNWGSVYWGNFDRAAAESDMVGVQGLRGSTKQSKDGMMTLYDGLLTGVKTLGAKFPGKAIMLTDIAVSSYPEPEYLPVQAAVINEVFDNLGTLKGLGVQAMIYRSWRDSPNMDPANYYGYAEQHWGLAWQSNGTLKASGHVWVAGVQAERAGSTSTTTSTTTTTTGTSAYTATVTPSPSSNEWWIQVGVSPAPAKVETKVGTGSYVGMDKQSYGWTKSLHAPAGTMVQFRVTSTDGQTATTPPQAWLVDMSAKTATSSTTTSSTTGTTSSATFSTTSTSTSTTTAASTTTTDSGPFTAQVSPSGNEWWVQANVASANPVTKVEAKAGSGSWISLTKESYGWAKSFNVPTGTTVQFRLTASDGATASTPGQAWLVDMSTKTATSSIASTSSTSTTASTTTTSTSATPTMTSSTSTSTTPSSTSTTSTSTTQFTASFTPKSVGNRWWVEVAVSANQPIAKVEAKVNNGVYTTLAPTDDGTYAASMHAPKGGKVTFRATSDTGQTVTSAAYGWK